MKTDTLHKGMKRISLCPSRSTKKSRNGNPLNRGFSMTELVVSLGAGTLLVTGSGIALQSTQKLVQQQNAKTTLRQNTVNGLRLMRSEIERSMHLVLERSEKLSEGMEHTDLNNQIYERTLEKCKSLSSDNFLPIIGTKMLELTEPVIYGLKTSVGATNYSLLRCGAPLNANGEYQESQEVFISPILTNISAIHAQKK